MKKIFIGIGSNIEKEKHIRCALQELQSMFGELAKSPVYESEALGFKGDNFLNLVVSFESKVPVAELSRQLKIIEKKYGRQQGDDKFSSKKLDLDILLVGNLVGEVEGVQLPRDEVYTSAFVLLPLSELAPEAQCPISKKSFSTLWQQFDQTSQKLWQANI